MRLILIDAMELKKSLPKFILEEAEAYIDETEEIEAIPIEWIKSKKTEITHEEYDFVRGCQEGFNDCIDYLISEWENENEKSNS